MRSLVNTRPFVRAAVAGGIVVLGLAAAAATGEPARTPADRTPVARTADHGKIVSSPFQGVKANTGNVAITHENGKCLLTLSDDFKIPEAPAPHWQIVDSKGNAFLLNRLTIKGEKYNKQVAVPAYIGDVAKVQIWCAFAEVNLGEAAFGSPIPNK